jgi:hypothetical protein
MTERLTLPDRKIIEDEPQTRGGGAALTISYPPDPAPEQFLRLAETSGTLDFWDEPEEDIYGPDDGTPV